MSIRFNNTDSFHLSTNQADRLSSLSAAQGRDGKTATELVSQVIEMGLYQLEYRAKRNRQQTELKKLGKMAVFAVNNAPTTEIDPATKRALAILLGMAEKD